MKGFQCVTPWEAIMDLESLTDDALLEEIHRHRRQLDHLRQQLETGQGTVEAEDLRRRMSNLNHLKLEARRRGLSVDGHGE